jgi:thymidylate kinase
MEARPVLNLIQRLCGALEAENISYCHWKSNAAIDRSASGDNDLDLLVHHAQARDFTSILYGLGFQEMWVRPSQQMPGILDYYGYDCAAEKFVHVHAHYQLVVGDDMTKNYRLPIEQPYLESAARVGLFKIPAPEFEFIVLVIRMVLKHGMWDSILTGQGKLPASAQRELKYLEERIRRDRVEDILQRHLPWLDTALFDRCLQSLRTGCPISTRTAVGLQLKGVLGAHARRSGISDTSLKLFRRVDKTIRRRLLLRAPRKKRMAHAGAMIAVVGGDGAGKTTTIDYLDAWLSKSFDTIRIHMGKPAWSWTTKAVRGALGLGRIFGVVSYNKLSPEHSLDASAPNFVGYAALMRAVCTARDRYRAYAKARRFATNGGLVILDRYSLPQIKVMDGPQIGRVGSLKYANRLVRLLAAAELRYYRQIMPPDILIALRVHPDVAVQRKTNEPGASVRARSREIWDLDWEGTSAHVIDAGRPRAAVLAEIKALIWSEL